MSSGQVKTLALSVLALFCAVRLGLKYQNSTQHKADRLTRPGVALTWVGLALTMIENHPTRPVVGAYPWQR